MVVYSNEHLFYKSYLSAERIYDSNQLSHPSESSTLYVQENFENFK
jgi:hypothetical protein